MSMNTPESAPSALDTAWAETLDFDDPAISADERRSALRALLTRRISRAPQPSRTVNQLHAVHERWAQHSKQLNALARRAPRIMALIRHALREAFALNPDSLLFSEPPPARHIDSLLDRTLALFSDPGVPINLNHFTALSLKDEPHGTLPFNAREALIRVSRLDLPARLNKATADYWQALAHGSSLSRRERWVQLRTAAFADQAFLAHQVFALSNAGYAMVKQLVDAPSADARRRAGGAWARLQVGTVLWPRVGAGTLAIPGALHLYREGAADGPQVVYLPGLQRSFHEFGSWRELQETLPARIQAAVFGVLWQYLPFKREAPVLLPAGAILAQDALAHSANALLDEQWSSEWGAVLSLDYTAPSTADAPLPSRRATALLRYVEKGRQRVNSGLFFATTLDELLEWDRQRRQAEVFLGSLSPDLPRKARHAQLRRYETGVEALLVDGDPGAASPAYEGLVTLDREYQEQVQAVSRWTEGDDAQLFEVAFWLERLDGKRKRASLILSAQRRALRLAAQLERSLELIEQPHLERLLEVLDKPSASRRGSSDTRVLRVSVGNPGDNFFELMGAFVVTTAAALAEPGLPAPALLVVNGRFGGLAAFDSLDGVSRGLRASFASRDGSVLWRCIGRDVRSAASVAMARSVGVSYDTVDVDVLYEDFKVQVEHHARLHKRLDQPPRVYSEVSDPSLGRALVAQALREHLDVPVNQTLARALANVAFVRFAAERAKSQPTWLATATRTERRRYRHLQRRYLANAIAMEQRLWQVLPQLQVFARNLLVAQLTRDGFYPELDIDAPLLEMPDDVSAQLCGWSSQCAVGDRHVKKIASPERTTFSLLQLALHNLDPQAPWTQWRLNRAHYLQPAWRARISPHYLTKTLSTLDIGGQYDSLIQRAFHPLSTELPRRLIDRATEQLAQLQVYSAARQGLSAAAQTLFHAAMAARSPADLSRNGLQIRLDFVRLRGHTMAHDRHLTGLLVIVDACSGRCLVYWPTAMDYPVLAEYSDVDRARAALNRAGASAATLKALAQRVAPGWEDEALASYPGQALIARSPIALLNRIAARQVYGFAVLVISEAISRFVRTFKIKHSVPAAELSTLEAHIQEQIDAEPTAWLEIVPTTHCDALAVFAHARMLEIQQRAHAVAVSGKTLEHYREQRLGEQSAATLRGLLSFIPVIGVGISLYEMLAAARRYHSSGRPEDAVDVAFLTLMAFVDTVTTFGASAKGVRASALRRGLNQLQRQAGGLARLPSVPRPHAALTRFRKPFSADGAVPLQGMGEKGVYVKNGEQFVVDGEYRYLVYRRGDEQGLRVKSPGGASEGELVLFIREDREWLLSADAPPASPQPGPSSAMWRPFSTPDLREWTPPSRVALQQRIRQSVSPPGAYESWAISSELTLMESVPGLGIYEVFVPMPQQGYRVVRHNGRYYRMLPYGSDVSPQTLVFITRNSPLEHAASLDIAYWLEVGLFDQPLPASFADGQWTIHRPLFTESLRVSLVRAFPFMTANSRTFLIARLLELSDPSGPLTASHLLSLRATLDQWLTPTAVGRTDDLLRLLRPLESTTSTGLYIGSESTTPGFERLDFTLRRRLHPSLQEPTQANILDRSATMQHAVRELLEEQGFTLRTLDKRPGSNGIVDFSCTHPQSDNLYYVLMRWGHTSSIKLISARAVQLTDEWFNLKFAQEQFASAYAPIKRAMDEGRLVRIMAGIHWAPTAPPTVYFVKFGSVKPGGVTPRRPRRKRPHSPG